MTYLPHQQRVVDEKTELDGKMEKLEAFLGTPLFKSLPAGEQHLLEEQYVAMDRYSDLLGLRIKAFTA